jgi:cellulose biosynthesis protein BcsQ
MRAWVMASEKGGAGTTTLTANLGVSAGLLFAIQ